MILYHIKHDFNLNFHFPKLPTIFMRDHCVYETIVFN